MIVECECLGCKGKFKLKIDAKKKSRKIKYNFTCSK